MFKLTNIIKGALLISLATQVGHSAEVFLRFSQTQTDYTRFFAYVSAVGIEMAIFIFTCKGKKNDATFFAVISFVLNLLYYYKTNADNFSMLATTILSSIIPYAVWRYATLIHDEMDAISENKAHEAALLDEIAKYKQEAIERQERAEKAHIARLNKNTKKNKKSKKRAAKVPAIEVPAQEPEMIEEAVYC